MSIETCHGNLTDLPPDLPPIAYIQGRTIRCLLQAVGKALPVGVEKAPLLLMSPSPT